MVYNSGQHTKKVTAQIYENLARDVSSGYEENLELNSLEGKRFK